MTKTHKFIKQLTDSYGRFIQKWGVFEQILEVGIFKPRVYERLLKSFDSLREASLHLNK
jgi:hypothetical protein